MSSHTLTGASSPRSALPIWVIPVGSLAFGFVAGSLASRIDLGDDSVLARFTYGGDADSSRSLLSSVIGGIVSITTLTLTITVVALQLASSQYSPRLMKRYIRDRSIQCTAGLFFFVFAFTIPVLFHVRSGDNPGGSFVPDVAITFVIFLAMVMLIGLVYFVYRVTCAVRVENILDEIARSALTTLGDRPPHADVVRTEPDAAGSVAVHSDRSGFLTDVDVSGLIDRLPADARLTFAHAVGDYVIEQLPIARCSTTAPTSTISEAVNAAITIGTERDERTEFAYGLRQISDIGVKALSPGINDPTTAIVSLDAATRILAVAATSGTRPVSSSTDRAEVQVPRVPWGELTFSTVDQFATYGCGDVQVARSLVAAMTTLIVISPGDLADQRLADALDSIETHLAEATIAPSESGSLRTSINGCRRLLTVDRPARADAFRVPDRTV